MAAKAAPYLHKNHNFGVFLKKGKRGILQLDFPNQTVLLIQRGHIKKTQPFSSLLYFESEEDLHLGLRFEDGHVDFEADTVEEKHTICRLLDLVIHTHNTEPVKPTGGVGVLPRVALVPHTVLKDGVLEKKGNTTITTWNRRRVKISAGEFSYFKPGEQLALNVVHMHEDRSDIHRVGQNTIQLSVNQRPYCFRVPNDRQTGLNVETVRDEWIEAFEQAMCMKRAVNFFSSSFDDVSISRHSDELSDCLSDVSSVTNSPFVSRKGLPDTFDPAPDPGNPEITASVSVHFSYNNANNSSKASINNNNNKGNPTSSSSSSAVDGSTLSQQTPKAAKRTTIYPFRPHNQDRCSDRGSDVVSRPHPDSVHDEVAVTALRGRLTESRDLGPRLATTSASLRACRNKTLNDRLLAFSDLGLGHADPKLLGQREVGDGETSDGTTPDSSLPVTRTKDTTSVLDLWRAKVASHEPADVTRWGTTAVRDDSMLGSTARDAGSTSVGGKETAGAKKGLWRTCSMSDLLDSKAEDGVGGGKPTAILPPPPPAVPAPPAVPPPPRGKGWGGGGVKLKQVHWTPVDKKLISVSLWNEGVAHVPTFDLKLLESMFAITEREKTNVNKTRSVRQTLIDGRRAQNLGILFAGFKDDCVGQLMTALASVTEPDNFQLQKMATLKRFQPTAEDTELLGLYRQSRDTLAPVDRFMLDLCHVTKLSTRIDLTLTLWDLPNNYNALFEVVTELLTACEVLLGNSSLPQVLRCLLSIGNHLNHGRQTKALAGFQLSSIDKMVDLRGREPQYGLVTFLVDQLEARRPALLHWTRDLTIVPKVAQYSVRAIGAEIDVLKNDLQKVKKYHKALKGLQGIHKKFHSDVQNFVTEYEKRMHTLQDMSDKLKGRFQQLLAWLGEPPSRTSDVLFSSLALFMDRFNTATARLHPTPPSDG